MKAARAFAASRIQAPPGQLPMSTQSAPPVITPPDAVGSPMRAAICPPMSTVGSPIVIMSPGALQNAASPARAAGLPHTITLEQPG